MMTPMTNCPGPDEAIGDFDEDNDFRFLVRILALWASIQPLDRLSSARSQWDKECQRLSSKRYRDSAFKVPTGFTWRFLRSC
jgi:hypothetical protein